MRQMKEYGKICAVCRNINEIFVLKNNTPGYTFSSYSRKVFCQLGDFTPNSIGIKLIT